MRGVRAEVQVPSPRGGGFRIGGLAYLCISCCCSRGLGMGVLQYNLRAVPYGVMDRFDSTRGGKKGPVS